MSESFAISSRSARLNSILLGRPEALSKERKEICQGINREGLLDALFVLYDECNKDAIKKKNKNIADFTNKYRPIIRETKQLRVNLSDFDVKTQIGSGYFGEVHLITEKYSKDVYAMKTIKKTLVANCQIREERDIMVLGRKSDWITRLQFAFQDRDNLYLVMEYLPGGDLLGLMIRNGAFDEELVRFYLAEIALALNALHSFGFVHRDIKPENILLDRFGHLKLADFGSAIAMNEDGCFVSISPVGTPDYVAPELLQILSTKVDSKSQKLGSSCDFWSMGIIGFEMITEKTPFHSDNIFDTYSEIQNFSDEMRLMQVLEFPQDVKFSRNLKDLLSGLITKPSRRMSFDEIQDHPFFNGINWHNLRNQAPPIIPTLSGEDDTSNFEDVDKSIKRSPVIKKSTFAPINVTEFSGDDLPFLGFTYIFEESSKFLKTGKTPEVQLESKLSNKIGDLQVTIKEQMREIKLLQKDLLSAERKAAQMNSLQQIYGETKEDMESMKQQLKDKITELAASKTEIKTLKSSLKVEEEMRLKNDSSIAEVLSQTYQKWERAKKISDQNFEKQLNERKSEVNSLLDRIQSNDNEMVAKIREIEHLNTTVEKYKDMLKTSKEQNLAEKNDYEDIRKQRSSIYEQKIQEIKQKLNTEKDQRSKAEINQQDLRKQLDTAIKSQNKYQEASEKVHIEIGAIRKQLGEKIDEANRMARDTKDLQTQNDELNRKNDELRKEMLKLQEENFKKQLRLSKIVSQPIQIGGRCSSDDHEFSSAHASLTELDKIDPEDLKSDLARAKENEDIQRKRADNLEEVVQRLEDMIQKVNKTAENTAGGLLERQNEKLEDQLAAVREQAILDRQSARTANLQLWKLEKEVSDLKHEKSAVTRRMETANEKCSAAIHEKESLELKIKQQLDIISSKETQIIDLQKDIRNLKYELKQEREKWSTNERERLREKTEIIQGNSKIKIIEEKLCESANKQRHLELRLSEMTKEKESLERQLTDEQNLYCNAQEQVNELQSELETRTRNYEMLKEAAATTEHQLNVVEDMWNVEVNHNKLNSEKIDDLWTKIRSRDEEISKLKRELSQEKTLKMSAESKGCQLQNESDELKEEMQNIQRRMNELQQQLMKKQEALYETQESMEVTSSDLQHLQKLKAKYENELMIMKEESSRILTDFYRSKEESKHLSMELKDARADIEDLIQDRDHLNGLLAEIRTHSKERDIRTEATVAQQKKLIEYLQQRVEELQNKKKRTIADVLFGANTTNQQHPPATPKTARKENIAPNNQDATKLREDLRRERERNSRLKENLMQTKLEIRKSTSMKSPDRVHEARESTVESTGPNESLTRTFTATVHAEPETKLESEFKQRETSSSSSPKAHHFAMTIETASPSPNAPATTCLACERIILMGQPYWQCKECKLSVHRKCRGSVKSNCLLGDGGASSCSTSEISSATTGTLNDSRKIAGIKKNLDDVDGIAAFPDDISSIGSSSDMEIPYQGDLILNSSLFGLGWAHQTAPKIHAVYELSDKIILFGCSTGLFSYHLEDKQLVQIKGITNVTYFSIKPNLTKSILIGDDGDNLYECDVRMLTNKSNQSSILEPKLNIQPIDLSIANRCGDERWHMVELHGTSEHLNEATAIAATQSRMVILKYDAKMGRFKPVRSLDTVTAIKAILFNQHSAIVACDKFFEIDLSSYVAEEFLDMSDHSLRPTKHSQPMNVFRINTNEFLICFRDYGIFVDEYGLRAREENLEWNQPPRQFFYKNFLLYIIHDDRVQIMRINNSTKKHEKDLRTDNKQSRVFVMLENDKHFTHNGMMEKYSVNILRTVYVSETSMTQDLITIDAEKAFKMNLNRSIGSIISDSNTSLATLSSLGATSADTIN